MPVSTVIGAIVLILIILNEAVSACRFLYLEGSYMRVSTVLYLGIAYTKFFLILLKYNTASLVKIPNVSAVTIIL